MSRKEDAHYAKVYLSWIADLDRQKRERKKCRKSVIDAVFQRDPLQKQSLMCDALVDHFTKAVYLQVFRIEDGKLYIK